MTAAVGFFAGTSIAQAAISGRYTVQGVTPSGTTINLFDYWVTGQDDPDNSTIGLSAPQRYQYGTDREFQAAYKKWATWYNGGINNSRLLKFGAGMGDAEPTGSVNQTNVNYWTKSAEPRRGIVSTSLGEDGYPVLSGALGNQSLSYLFDTSSFDGKTAYSDVSNLLRVDSQGYYYYDCKDNFAEFVPDGEGSGSFTLYNKGGVYAGGSSPDGQFFPFNEGEDVFEEGWNDIQAAQIKSTNEVINHYFGMTMSTRFAQQYCGHTDANSNVAVTYNFSGDDDVWIYIDDVLIGDLGGIHNATSIEINFETGSVVIYDDSSLNEQNPGYRNNKYDNGEKVYQRTTLRDLFNAGNNDPRFDGDTFADDTYHTLDFFYLERGNTDSNMSLKYNLVTIPETDIQKVDQVGDPISNVTFNVKSGDNTICRATTDGSGNVVLTDENDFPITLEDLYKEGYSELTLEEVNTPSGYRSYGPFHMRLVVRDGSVLLLSGSQSDTSEYWETGAYALSKVTTRMSVDPQVGGATLTESQMQNGTMFVVVEKYFGENNWRPVYGDPVDGWTVLEDDSKKNIIEAARETGAVFVLASSGSYQAEVDGLPGDVLDYVFFDGNDGDGDGELYRGVYYYVNSSSLDEALETGAELQEIQNSGEFERQFSARLYVPNILNRFIVQKLDDAGNPVNGATISLYNNESVEVGADGAATLRPNATALKTETTRQLTKGTDSIDLNGAVVFSGLESGTYWVCETSAPAGYALNATLAKVIVDNTGVYADAGVANDGTTVTRGVGRLVRSMIQFAVDDDIDATLHDIVATPMLGTKNSWEKAVDEGALHLSYADEKGAVLDYSASEADGQTTFTVDEGIPSLKIEQCATHETNPRQNLSGIDLTNLFTGTTIVHIENERKVALEVTKQLKNADAIGAPSKEETYRIAFTFVFPGGTTQEDLSLIKAQTMSGENMPTSDEFKPLLSQTEGESLTYTYKQDIKAGETIKWFGLPEGTRYTVTEETTGEGDSSTSILPNGVKLISITDADGMEDASENPSASGTLSYDGNEVDRVIVTNEFVLTPVACTLDVAKTVTGADNPGDFSFTAELTSGNADGVQSGLDGDGKLHATVAGGLKDGQTSKANFPELTFSKAGTYTFKVTEDGAAAFNADTANRNGWTYDDTERTVTVVVENNGDGTLSASFEGARTPEFVNEYEAEFVVIGDNEADLQVTKSVTGAGALSEFEFKLQLTTNNADGVQGLDADNSITKKTSGLTGTQGTDTVDFGDLTFTKPGDYVFTVTETTTTSAEGWTYDNAPKTITVHVTDPGDGQLDATVEGNNPIATNKYNEPYIPPTPTPDETDPSKSDLDVDKTLTGHDMVAGEFSFTITATGDNADHVSPKTLTGTNDASGNVSFSGDGFIFDEAGEYTFTVSEVLPQDDDPETPGVQHNGVTYDETTYAITAKVTKGAGNKLVATWDLGSAAGGVTFANTYEPDETASVSLGATKVLNGRDLVAGEFTFELVDGQGNVVATATNAADGSVIFSSIEFTEAGTYTYLIREVAGSLANVTYDTATHTATVTVTDNGDGTLTATVLYDGSGAFPVFTNTYKVPEEPGEPDKPGKPTEPTKPSKPEEPQKPATPDTGDHTNAAAPVALALSGVALVAGAYVLRVRRNR